LPVWPGEQQGGAGGGLEFNKAVADGLAPLFLVDEEYRVALLDAEAAFVERLIERITDPENGWTGRWTEHLNQVHLP
jgi:hypothetical protein